MTFPMCVCCSLFVSDTDTSSHSYNFHSSFSFMYPYILLFSIHLPSAFPHLPVTHGRIISIHSNSLVCQLTDLSPIANCSLAQPPPGGAHRLSSVSSHDSGFISQDTNVYSKPPSPMPSDITSQVGAMVPVALTCIGLKLPLSAIRVLNGD